MGRDNNTGICLEKIATMGRDNPGICVEKIASMGKENPGKKL